MKWWAFIGLCLVPFIAFAVHQCFWVWIPEQQRIYAAYKAELLQTYPRSALILRGESICRDGCDADMLQNGKALALAIRDKLLRVYENRTQVRWIDFPACAMENIHKFGLSTNGHPFVTQYAIRSWYRSRSGNEEPYEQTCILDDSPYVAILFEESGYLRFIKAP